MSTQTEKDKGKTFGKVKNWHPSDRFEPDRANWDKRNTEQFLSCVLHEFTNNNRNGQYLSPKGYDGLIESFYTLTGKYHDFKQMKNKFDALKKDWVAWNQLRGQNSTGLGFDNETKTYTAPEHWWEKMIAINQHCQKFRTRGLDHEELLDQIFQKTSATGKTQWTPGEEFLSDPGIDDMTTNLDDTLFDEGDYYGNNQSQFDVNLDDIEFGSVSGTKGKPTNRQATTTGKKRKSTVESSKRLSTSGMLQKTIEHMVGMIENQGSEVTIKRYSDTTEATIPTCLAKLNQLPGIVVGSSLYIKATKLMTQPAQREVFMSIPDDGTRVIWLKSFGKKKKARKDDE